MKPTGGSYLSLVEERKGVPFRDWLNGPRLALALLGWLGGDLGQLVPGSAQWLLLPFFCSGSFPIFLFHVSFISFAKILQINSNHFQKFSKTQHKV
jgi:hypothetical protein